MTTQQSSIGATQPFMPIADVSDDTPINTGTEVTTLGELQARRDRAKALSNEQREVLMQEARMIAARAYDVCLGYMPDGSPMQTVPYRAIMGGHYDSGSIVQQPFADLIAKLDLVDTPPDTQGERQ